MSDDYLASIEEQSRLYLVERMHSFS